MISYYYMISDNKFKKMRDSNNYKSLRIETTTNKQYLLSSGIPEKYWYGEDPVKSILMNESVKTIRFREKFNII